MSDTIPPGRAGRNLAQTLEWCSLVLAVATSVVLVGGVLWRAGSGFDFSDEGYYLGTISHPHLYGASTTQFGFIYHPLFRLVGEDIALFRRTNILITLGLAWILGFGLCRKIATPEGEVDRGPTLPLAAVAAVLSTNALVILRLWMPTPNYNILALQSLLLAGIGMLLADANSSRRSASGGVLIGLSGWLAFMAKPTTAMALGVVVGLYLLLSGKLKLRLLVIAVATAALLGWSGALLIDGSTVGFVQRLIRGAEDAKLFDEHHTLAGALRWDTALLRPSEKGALVATTLLVFLATLLSCSPRQTQRLGGAAFGLAFSLVCGSLVTGLVFLDWTAPQFLGLQYGAAPFGALLATLALAYRSFPRLIARDRLVLALSFAVFPHVYAFGTDANYWASASWASFFWVLAGIVVLGSNRGHKLSWRAFLPMAAGVQVCTALILVLYMEHPYRQTQPLRQNDDVMQIASTGSKLRVSRDFAEYLRKLGQLANNGGFEKGTAVIDLTGHYPGALYAIGARLTGRPWMIGGYPGSESLAIVTLDRVSREELRNAWIFTEPNGPRRLSPDILKRYGIDPAKDYLEVGTIDSPTGTYPDSYRQHLLKPIKGAGRVLSSGDR